MMNFPFVQFVAYLYALLGFLQLLLTVPAMLWLAANRAYVSALLALLGGVLGGLTCLAIWQGLIMFVRIYDVIYHQKR